MTDPDFETLKAVSRELRALADAGTLTEAEYTRLFADAEQAAGEHTEFLEGIIMRGLEHGFVTAG